MVGYGGYSERTARWSGKAVIVLGVLAAILVAAVPVALFAGVILMLFGHVVGGLALFGASILAAGAAVVIAASAGVRHLRALVSRQSLRIVQLRRDQYGYDDGPRAPYQGYLEP